MTKAWAPIIANLSAWFLLLAALGCGSSNRQLQSIAVTSTGAIEGNMIQLQFVAAGSFNASPTTVNPLAVSWYVVDQDAPPAVYTLTSQPFSMMCKTGASRCACADGSTRTEQRYDTEPSFPRPGHQSNHHFGRRFRRVHRSVCRMPLVGPRPDARARIARGPAEEIRLAPALTPHFGMSRCPIFTRYPAWCRRLPTSSAIITERCWPPVQPKLMVR